MQYLGFRLRICYLEGSGFRDVWLRCQAPRKLELVQQDSDGQSMYAWMDVRMHACARMCICICICVQAASPNLLLTIAGDVESYNLKPSTTSPLP